MNNLRFCAISKVYDGIHYSSQESNRANSSQIKEREYRESFFCQKSGLIVLNNHVLSQLMFTPLRAPLSPPPDLIAGTNFCPKSPLGNIKRDQEKSPKANPFHPLHQNVP
jgi:hypothetical protein